MNRRSRLTLRLEDLLSGKSVLKSYDSLKSTEFASTGEIAELQAAKLERVLRYCMEQVPFYRDIVDSRLVRSVADRGTEVLEDLPVISKRDVIKRWQDVRPVTTRRGVHTSQTGGTTGEPLRVPKDPAVRSQALGAYWRFADAMGVELTDPKLLVWGRRLIPGSRLGQLKKNLLLLLEKTQFFDAFDVSTANPTAVHSRLVHSGAVFIRGYCLAIYEIARLLLDLGISFPVKAVSTTVEPLFPEYRAAIMRAFRCEVFDQYGCGEVESIAFECPAHGGLHVTPERCILEVGEDGRVIVTDLDNMAFPLVRYTNGDQVELASAGCGCGRPGAVITKVVGRMGDVIIGPNGTRLHPEFFTHLINELGVSFRRGVKRYQVVQESKDKIVWRLASDPLSREEIEQLRTQVVGALGEIILEFEVVDDLATERSGKFRYVVGMERNLA